MITRLERIDKTIVFLVLTMIDASLQDVWNLISTNDGFARWFPELEVHNDDGYKVIHFINPTFEEVFQVIEFRKESTISFTWSDAIVTFTIEPHDNSIHLTFEEHLPLDFPYLSRDITGWTMNLSKLKAVAEKNVFEFTQKEFINQEHAYQTQLANLN